MAWLEGREGRSGIPRSALLAEQCCPGKARLPTSRTCSSEIGGRRQVPVATPAAQPAPAGDVPCARWAAFWWAGNPDMNLLSQAAQNLIVLAREEAGAEKIFQSDGVRLLTQLLDTAKADLMLAALRTLVGLCSGHRSRVGPAVTQLSCMTGPDPGESMSGRLRSMSGRGASACGWLQPC